MANVLNLNNPDTLADILKFRTLVLVGDSGCGKTSLALAFGCALAKAEGDDVRRFTYKCTDFEELKSITFSRTKNTNTKEFTPSIV